MAKCRVFIILDFQNISENRIYENWKLLRNKANYEFLTIGHGKRPRNSEIIYSSRKNDYWR